MASRARVSRGRRFLPSCFADHGQSCEEIEDEYERVSVAARKLGLLVGGNPSATRAIASAVLWVCVTAASGDVDHLFSGRWRMDTTSITGAMRPTVFRIRDGQFSRDRNPAVPADGRFHAIEGSAYIDEQSITIVGDHLVKEVDRLRGKTVYTSDYVVSLDGSTLTWRVASYTSPDGKAALSETVQRRVGKIRKGVHLLSGTWKRVSLTADPRSDWILKLDGSRFSWRTPGGTGYDAIIGGAPVRLDGDNSGVRAQVTRPRPDLIVETDLSVKGTVDDTLSMQLMPDGETLHATGVYGPEKRVTKFVLRKLRE